LELPSQLRVNVTSPGGTTQAALEILMDDKIGLAPLINQVVNAATLRSKHLGKQ
jgi:pyrroline-5-carboxylate reductase